MKNNFLIVLMTLLLSVVGFSQNNLVQYVDTKIGANSKRASNCVIGPELPFGCINPSPQSAPSKNTSGYDPKFPVRGFGQLHVSGTGGAGKYGHFLITPQKGLAFGLDEHYSSMTPEFTQAYYFKALLSRYQIETEISPTRHCAIYRFSFPQSDSASIIIDATQSVTIDVLKREADILDNNISIDTSLKIIKAMIRFKGGWGGKEPYNLFLVAEYDKQSIDAGLWKDKDILRDVHSLSRENIANQRIGSFCRFRTKEGEQILMKVAISSSSFDHAELYLKNEIAGWDFEKIKTLAMNEWENQLAKIKIDTKSEIQKKIFYTAMYHSMVMPRDKTGDNPKWTSNLPYWDDHYATWDTWRTLYPLHTLINQEVVSGTIVSYLDRFKHNGLVKDAFIAGVDMINEQGGNDIDNVIADAFVKGVQGINWEEAYKLMKVQADFDRICYKNTGILDTKLFSNEYYQKGWISQEWSNASSATLEFAYNDYCIAEVAKGLGKNEDAEKYRKRSSNWENLWDSTTKDNNYKGFIGIKDSSGKFTNFAPSHEFGSWKYPFYEGSSWTYSYFVPHNYPRLIVLMGGEERFAERLDFALKHNLIDYSNEPSFVALRAFSHAHRPDLTNYWVRFASNKNFDLSGVTGNDDSGAMSSWYIFSALGFFPNAGQDIYYLNAPIFDKSLIQLSNGKKLTIIAKNGSEKNIYIKTCKINGKKWNSPIFRHSDIANGGTIEMELIDTPTKWARN